ncbi:DUF1311 domain-containing protein [Rheinheimera baltica]|uniref:DUF1311 domain-containing protein n=1 Tax=Rheinheimera baltica TaxID=67576 RepID=A0ABT9I564_9GAMM|nr:lysozyme inhibitor LprI family protein [Rheinheimera baltica]MDP5138549.1 DUF1311 domain-containing protein [Rheinheimera baltica]MDP5148957.1 DUF1311 domain-containing protein [Rheinheimera baltica]
MKLSVAFLLCVLSFSSYAESENSIEKSLDECLAKRENQTTAGMNTCVGVATVAWDKELNVVYGNLMSALDAEGKNNLKKSQIAWLKHRDLEYKFISSVYATKVGTMYSNIRAMNVLTLTKNRALELKSYLSSSEL